MWYRITGENFSYGIGTIPGRRGPKKVYLYKLNGPEKEIVATFKTEEQARAFLEIFMGISEDADKWRRLPEYLEDDTTSQVDCQCPECNCEFQEDMDALYVEPEEHLQSGHHILSFSTRS